MCVKEREREIKGRERERERERDMYVVELTRTDVVYCKTVQLMTRFEKASKRRSQTWMLWLSRGMVSLVNPIPTPPGEHLLCWSLLWLLRAEQEARRCRTSGLKPFFCKKISASTLLCCREQRSLLTIIPAAEKTRSAGTDVAGMHKKRRAKLLDEGSRYNDQTTTPEGQRWAVPGDWKCKAGLQLQCQSWDRMSCCCNQAPRPPKALPACSRCTSSLLEALQSRVHRHHRLLGAVATPRAKRRSSALVRDLFSSDKNPSCRKRGSRAVAIVAVDVGWHGNFPRSSLARLFRKACAVADSPSELTGVEHFLMTLLMIGWRIESVTYSPRRGYLLRSPAAPRSSLPPWPAPNGLSSGWAGARPSSRLDPELWWPVVWVPANAPTCSTNCSILWRSLGSASVAS